MWFESNILEFEPSHPYSLRHNHAVFHFLVNADDRKRYRESLLGTLRPEGHLVLATFAISGQSVAVIWMWCNMNQETYATRVW